MYKCTGCNEWFNKKVEINKHIKLCKGIAVKLNSLDNLNTDYISNEYMDNMIKEINKNPDKSDDVIVKLLLKIFNDPEHPENHIIKCVKESTK